MMHWTDGLLPPEATPRWWRLVNPDAVHVDFAHVEPDDAPLLGADPATVLRRARHVVRVSRVEDYQTVRDGVTRRTVVSSDTDLVPTRLGVSLDAAAQFGGRTVFVHTVGPPPVGEWTQVPVEDVLASAAERWE